MAYDFKTLKEETKNVEEWLRKEFMTLRTGQATPAILDGIRVESYGAELPLIQVANVGIEDARVLRITPYDKSQSKEIEKAVTAANLGVSVSADDKGVRVFFPELTSERREVLIRTAKGKLEDAKVNVRGFRDETWKDIQAKEKEGDMGEDDMYRAKDDMQKIIDETNRNLDALLEKKEKEINS